MTSACQPQKGCPLSGRCGGCTLSAMPYEEQLLRKHAEIKKLLGRYGRVSPVVGMDQPLHYRNKVHGALATDRRGLPISGVYAAGTHRVVPVTNCLLEDEAAGAVIRTILMMLPKYKLAVYNEDTKKGFLRHVLIRTGANTGQMLVVLVASSLTFPGGKAFVKELIAQHPAITSVVLNENRRQTSMVLGQKETVLYGEGYLTDTLCGLTFRISPQSFYQVNARQAEVLYRTAMDLAGLTGQETMLDAYCGTGTIGLCAAAHAKEVLGVELNPDAVQDAKANARLNHIRNARFLCDDAGRFMRVLAKEGTAPDVVIMDPPRSGSDRNFLQSLMALSPKRVVYVSCNPVTQARDLAILTKGGYRVEKIVPVDMFPMTEHCECVVGMRKG